MLSFFHLGSLPSVRLSLALDLPLPPASARFRALPSSSSILTRGTLVTHPGLKINTDKFEEVYKSVNGLVRIVRVLQVSEESKAWGANPDNRECDAPGSWYCPGTLVCSNARVLVRSCARGRALPSYLAPLSSPYVYTFIHTCSYTDTLVLAGA